VRFDFSSVPRSAGSSSPVVERRRGPLCAVARRRRRSGCPRLGSRARVLRPGASPVLFGAL
jgi:hypothetical protein